MEVHDPRLPTLAARRAALGSPRRVVRSLLLDATPARLHRATWGRIRLEPEEQAILRGVYDATLMDLDRATELLLADLRRRGELEHAIVVLTSDHGEMLGEHGQYRHNRGVWQELVHVPLVVHVPAAAPAVVARPVSTAGVFRALCALAHLSCPDDPRMDRSVELALRPSAALVADAADVAGLPWGAERGPEPVISVIRDPVGDRRPDDPPWLWRAETAVFDGRWKLVLTSEPGVRLVDLARDPGERVDLSAERPEVVRRLRGWLRRHLQDHRWHHPVVPARRELDASGLYRDAATEALQALGYVE